jgi:hypothetical protein
MISSAHRLPQARARIEWEYDSFLRGGTQPEEEVSWSEVYLGVIVCVRDRTESIKKLAAGLGTGLCLLYWYQSGGLLVQRYKY